VRRAVAPDSWSKAARVPSAARVGGHLPGSRDPRNLASVEFRDDPISHVGARSDENR